MPSLVTIVAFVSPRASTSATGGSSAKAASSAGAVVAGGDQVDVAHGLAPAAQRARLGRRDAGRMRAHALQQLARPAPARGRAGSRPCAAPPPTRWRPGSSPPPSRPAPSPRARGRSRTPRAGRRCVVTPSSSYSRRVVLAPTPGRRMTSTRPGGNCASSLLERRRACPVSSSSSTLAAIVSPTSGSSVRPPLARQPLDRLAGLAEARGRLPVGEHAVDDGAVQLVEVAEPVDRCRRGRRSADATIGRS